MVMMLAALQRGWTGPPLHFTEAKPAMLPQNLRFGVAATKHGRFAPHQHRPDRFRRTRRAHVASAGPRWNPQNVDDPVKVPNVALSAHEAVAVQLDALQQNDSPWSNHGVQTMYVFGEGIGGLDPAWYFGYQKDLYHQDHFSGMFASAFPQLINAHAWEITATKEVDDNRTLVEAAVAPRGSNAGGHRCSVTFALRRKIAGSNQGAWLTKMLLHGDLQQALAHIDQLAAR